VLETLAGAGIADTLRAALKATADLDAAIAVRPDAGDTAVIIAAKSLRELRAELEKALRQAAEQAAAERVDREAMQGLWNRAMAASAAEVAALEAKVAWLHGELDAAQADGRPRLTVAG
jgi:ubiquinone biosynthesis protein UbiJ